jgi:S-adenosylmethionine:tRNA ribosyltransferase-isomerase
LTSLFDYQLPDELVAQYPLAERDAARLLVVDEATLRHDHVRNWPALLPPGALVVVNDTRVRRCRITGERRGTRGRVELLLVRRLPSRDASAGGERWECLGRASKPLRPGSVIECGPLRIAVEARQADGALWCLVHSEQGSIDDALERTGHMPIPPYLRREDEPDDAVRYQTVYARALGSAAAPTAGLHLSPDMLSRLEQRGVALGSVTLHVGLGTFKPVTARDLDEHDMHAESFEVSPELASQVALARARGAPVVAVGTTVVRALESAADPDAPGHVSSLGGETRLLIQPGYQFRVVDALFTNFHAPRSTLLALVAAFAGRDRILGAYAEAVRARYRFLSYGDAMWLPRNAA